MGLPMIDQEKIALLQQRRQFFKDNLPSARQTLFRKDDKAQLSNTCPACGYPTLDERSAWEICAICWWEDDGQDDLEADEVWGGPNGDYSLTQWRLRVAKTLAALSGDSADHSSVEKDIGVLLKTIHSTIESGHATDMDKLIKQLKMMMLLFDKLHQSRFGGSPNFSPNR
jgi:hypothetical protein